MPIDKMFQIYRLEKIAVSEQLVLSEKLKTTMKYSAVGA
jgi:hypothetical protein